MVKNVVEVEGASYYMNPRIKKVWDKLKDGKLTKRDDDRFFIVDGREGTGKSVLTFQNACYIDPSLVHDLSRICFSAEEFIAAVTKTKSTDKETKVIVFDEAFRGMSSKSGLSKINKLITSVLQEMRQRNLVVFLVTPSFFMLETYPAILRSEALFHVIKNKKNGRRYWRCYNHRKKGMLYNIGLKKGWSYPVKTGFKDYFYGTYPGGADFEARYRAKKDKALQIMTKTNVKGEYATEKERKIEERVGFLLAFMKERMGMSINSIAKVLDGANFDLKRTQIMDLIRQSLEKQGKVAGQTPQKLIYNRGDGLGAMQQGIEEEIMLPEVEEEDDDDEIGAIPGVEEVPEQEEASNGTQGGSLPVH